MDAEKIVKRAQEIAEEIRGRRMVFTDQDWPDDTGDQYVHVYTYSYYTHGRTPIRILSRLGCKWAVGEFLNYRTGRFEENIEALIDVEYDKGGGAYKVSSKAAFYKLCEAYMAEHTPEKIAERDLHQQYLIDNADAIRERMKQLAYEAKIRMGTHKDGN